MYTDAMKNFENQRELVNNQKIKVNNAKKIKMKKIIMSYTKPNKQV